ncbi:MAG TPA: GNAT family N-acetyltransferase [Thermodesulfobacteriota bacterium]
MLRGMTGQASAEAPIISIAGERVALGPLRRDLLPLYERWVNDFEVTRSTDMGMRPRVREFEDRFYDRVATSERDVVFTIYERPGLRPIGLTGLHDVDQANRRADFGILIGEKASWGKGYGTEATRLVLEYAFVALGLHNVMLRVYAFNERGIRAYERAGFRVIGRRRECKRLGSHLYDEIYMDCVATEFQATVLTRLLPAPRGR